MGSDQKFFEKRTTVSNHNLLVKCVYLNGCFMLIAEIELLYHSTIPEVQYQS